MKTPILCAAIVACSFMATATTAQAADALEFTTLHAQHLTVITQRTTAFNNKLDQIQSQVNQLPAEYGGYKNLITNQINMLKARVSIGSYSITIPPQFVIKVPNENLLDNLIDQLKDMADDLEDDADDNDNDFAEDIGEEIKDLVRDLDRLEDRLTDKTNDLKQDWVNLGGSFEYF